VGVSAPATGSPSIKECSSNLVNGPNSDGSWTITNVNGTQFTLNGSTGIVSPTVTGSGGVGTQTEAILSESAPTLQYSSGFSFSGFTNLIVCKQTDLAAVNSGFSMPLTSSRSFSNCVEHLEG